MDSYSILTLLSLTGLALSVYAAYIQYQLSHNPNYKPYCNLSDTISCTKPIQSTYGKLFIFSNNTWGIIFYTLFLGAAQLHLVAMLKLLAAGGLIGSLILAYILYSKIKVLCMVCTMIYSINILLAYVSFTQL